MTCPEWARSGVPATDLVNWEAVLADACDEKRNPLIRFADNPFAGVPGKRGEIGVMGLRNPHRFSFDRQTGGSVYQRSGQTRFEEIDFKAAGSSGCQNYGWPYLEGNHCYADADRHPQPNAAPITEYSHAPTMRRNGRFSLSRSWYWRMQGVFFFADFSDLPCVGLEACGWRLADIARVAGCRLFDHGIC